MLLWYDDLGLTGVREPHLDATVQKDNHGGQEPESCQARRELDEDPSGCPVVPFEEDVGSAPEIRYFVFKEPTREWKYTAYRVKNRCKGRKRWKERTEKEKQSRESNMRQLEKKTATFDVRNL